IREQVGRVVGQHGPENLGTDAGAKPVQTPAVRAVVFVSGPWPVATPEQAGGADLLRVTAFGAMARTGKPRRLLRPHHVPADVSAQDPVPYRTGYRRIPRGCSPRCASLAHVSG